MGMRNVIVAALLLCATATQAVAQFRGGTGEYRGLVLAEKGVKKGECSVVDLLTGANVTRTSDTCSLSSTSIVWARDYLYCDGVHDDRVKFKDLVETGACAGKACVIDGSCTMLWSSCTSGTGDCTAITVPVGTRIIAEPGANDNIKLAGRSCVGGNTPGAACPNGVGDCNGGTCEYDCSSSGSAGCAVTDKEFAHTTAATYTLFKSGGPDNTTCSAAGSPYACCTGSGTGFCQYIDQDISIVGLRVAGRQLENFFRCTNGSTENGWACNGYCGPATTFPGMSCSEDGNTSDCLGTPTCVNKALCPGANNDCDGAPLSISGTGAVTIVDMANASGVVVQGVTVHDYVKGSGIKVGLHSRVEDVDLTAVSGNQYVLPWSSLATFGLNALTYNIPNAITAGAYSRVSGNQVRSTGTAISNGALPSLQAYVQPVWAASIIENNLVLCPAANCIGIDSATPASSIRGNNVTCSGDGCTGIRWSGTSDTVDSNIVTVSAGDYVFGLRGTTASTGSSVSNNHVSVGPAGDTDGVGMELAGNNTKSTGNYVSVAHTTRATGARFGTTTGSCFPDCTFGADSTSSGDTITTGTNGVHIELFGDRQIVTGYNTGLSAGSQAISLGQNSQMVIDGASITSGAVGVGGSNRKYCNAGTNDGKICKQDTTAGATCTGGTCAYDDISSNFSVMNSRIHFQTQAGVYGMTGMLLAGDYIAWQTGRAVMLGDDRVNAGRVAGHSSINGGLFHLQANNISHITFPDIGDGNCTAPDTPWDCCTGNGTGACTAGVGNATITGVDFLTFGNTGVSALDFATSFDANSPSIVNITFAGNACYFPGASNNCIALPASNQSKVTALTISNNGYNTPTYISNWNTSMGTRDDEFTACTTKAALVAADDDYPIFTPYFPVTIVGFGCNCQGACGGTAATLTLEDGGGSAMTVTGTNPTCATTGNATFADVTAGNSLQAGETVAFDVTNTPQTGNNYIVCVRYTKP